MGITRRILSVTFILILDSWSSNTFAVTIETSISSTTFGTDSNPSNNTADTKTPNTAVTDAKSTTDKESLSYAPSTAPPMCIDQSTPKSKEYSYLPHCSLPVDELHTGRNIHFLLRPVTPFPKWTNVTLLQIGQAFCRKYRFSITFGALVSTLAGLPVRDAADIECFADRTDFIEGALKRYVATVAQMYVWFDEVITSTDYNDNLILFTSFFQSNVLHDEAKKDADAAKKPLNGPHKYDSYKIDEKLWEAVEKDLQLSNLPYRNYSAAYYTGQQSSVALNQFIQGVAIDAFIGSVMTQRRNIFIYDVTDEEYRGFLHLWAFVAWGFGVEDPYNICLQKDIPSAQKYFQELHLKVVVSSWFLLDKCSKVLLEALVIAFGDLLNGLPKMSLRLGLFRLLTESFEIDAPNTWHVLSLEDKKVLVEWFTVLVPLTHLDSTREKLNAGVMKTIQDVINKEFGPAYTNQQKVEHVFFPDPYNCDPAYKHGC